MPAYESSDDLPSHLQWTLSRDLFSRVFFSRTGSWMSRSAQVPPAKRPGERQPLVKGNINRNYSCNEIYQGKSRSLLNPGVRSLSAQRALWPTLSNLPLNLASTDPVTIYDVCRSATPLLPPVIEEEEGVSWITASFLLINAALGIGILNFPAAYDMAGGVVSATVTQLVMVTLIVCTMLILAHCSDVNQDVTYHDVLLSMCGRTAQKLAAVSITFTCYGVCCAILIIIGDQLDSLFVAAYGPSFCHQWYMERHFTIPLASVVLILPICYFRRVDFLRYAGSLGVFAMLYPVFLTFYGYFKLDIKDVRIKHEPDSISQLLVVVPVLCLAYQCQEVVVPVYACMRRRTLRHFAASCCVAMAFLVATYSVIGCFGYLTFGSLVSPNIMKMYDAQDPVVMVGIGALVVKMVVTYPVLALCGRGAVDGLYAETFRLSALEFVKGERTRRVVIATVWFTSSLLIGVFTSSIGTVIHALGAVSSANIFIYPGVCLMRVTLQTDPDMKRWRSYLLILSAILLAGLGAFFSGLILVDTFRKGISGKEVEKICS